LDQEQVQVQVQVQVLNPLNKSSKKWGKEDIQANGLPSPGPKH
jgi:hypothetical protein